MHITALSANNNPDCAIGKDAIGVNVAVAVPQATSIPVVISPTVMAGSVTVINSLKFCIVESSSTLTPIASLPIAQSGLLLADTDIKELCQLSSDSTPLGRRNPRRKSSTLLL